MKQDKNMVALYVDKDTVNIYKASLDLYAALKSVMGMGTIVNSYEKDKALKALAKAGK